MKESNSFLESSLFLTMHFAILHIHLPLVHEYYAKLSSFTFCEGREHKKMIWIYTKYSPLDYNSRKIGENLRNWMRWNNTNEVWNSENSHFKWPFLHRCRQWLFKFPNEGIRRAWRTLHIFVDPTLLLANLTCQATVTSRTCRYGVHSPISCSNRDKQ